MKETPRLALLQVLLIFVIALSSVLFLGRYNASTITQCAYGGALAFSVAAWSLALFATTLLIEPLKRLVSNRTIRRMDYIFSFGVFLSAFWLIPYFYLYFCIVW